MNTEEFDAQVAVDTPRYLEHLWEDILPVREVNLLGGPSGAGKTTWLMKWLEDFKAGKTIYGKKTFPVDYVYITGDRSHDGMMRTLHRLKIDPQTFPLYLPPRSHKTIDAVLNGAKTKYPNAKLFIIEGLATWVPNGKLHDYWVVADFLRNIGDYCVKHNITVLGVVHSPKMKEKDRYDNPRDRVMGSAAWSGYAETIFLMEQEEMNVASDKNSRRLLFILPRQSKNQIKTLDFKEDGQLYEVRIVTNESRFLEYLATVVPTEAGISLFTYADAEAGTKLHPRSLEDQLKRATDKGLIERVKQGMYKINKGKA